MSEHTENVKIETSTPQTAAPATGAAPAKPKRPKPKSMIMLGEQTAALFDNARLAKERGEKVGWSASIFPQEIAETLGLNVLYPETIRQESLLDTRPTRFSRNAKVLSATPTTSAHMRKSIWHMPPS